MRLPFSFLLVWRPTNYLHQRLSSLPGTRTDVCSLLYRYKLPSFRSSAAEADGARREGAAAPLQAGALQGRGRGRRHVQDERG